MVPPSATLITTAKPRLLSAAKTSALSRAKARSQKYSQLTPMARERGLLLLQLARAGEPTRAYLEKALATFEKRAAEANLTMMSYDDVDIALDEYRDHLFFAGAPADQGD